MPATNWCSPSGLPPTSRVCANAVISSTRRCAAPTQRAATIIRSNRNQSWVNVIGSPSAPTRCDSRNPDVVERHDRVLVGDVVRIVRCANHFHARPRQIDHQQHVVTRMLAGRQHGLDEDVVGEVVRRDVPLDPVDHVLVAVAARGGLQRRHVGAGELLGDRVRLVLLAAHRRQQPALALVVGGHLGPPLRRGGHHPRQAVGDPAALFLHQHLLQGRAARTAHRRRHVRGVQTQLDRPPRMLGRQLLRQQAARQLGLDLVRHQRLDEGPRRVADPQILLRESVHRETPLLALD